MKDRSTAAKDFSLKRDIVTFIASLPTIEHVCYSPKQHSINRSRNSRVSSIACASVQDIRNCLDFPKSTHDWLPFERQPIFSHPNPWVQCWQSGQNLANKIRHRNSSAYSEVYPELDLCFTAGNGEVCAGK